MPEVLLYGPIESYTVPDIIKEIDEHAEADELTMRINSGGGSPEYGWGVIAKFAEFTGKKRIANDGKAFSMAAFASLYTEQENVECLDVTEFMYHRAAYPSWFESNAEFFTDELRGNLERINKNLEAAFRNRVDVAKFEQLKGVKVKDMFSMGSRVDVFLSAQEAKTVGIVGKINKITPSKRAELNASFASVSAKYNVEVPEIAKPEQEEKEASTYSSNQNNDKMNIEELKTKHPTVYAEVLALGKSEGITEGAEAERDRVGAWSAFAKADPEAVQAGIKSGKNISQTEMAELTVKLASAGKIEEIEKEEKDKPGASAATDKPDATVEPTAAQKLEADVMGKLNIKKD